MPPPAGDLRRTRMWNCCTATAGPLLPGILSTLDRPALFLARRPLHGGGLRAHGVTEIEALLQHPVTGHVVLIDDAREFSGTGGYPTVDRLRGMILERQPLAHFVVADDIIQGTTRPNQT